MSYINQTTSLVNFNPALLRSGFSEWLFSFLILTNRQGVLQGQGGVVPRLRTASPSLPASLLGRCLMSKILKLVKVCQSGKNEGLLKRALASRPGCGQRFVVHAPVVGIGLLILKHRPGISHRMKSAVCLGCVL
jgi:hypothetical protein